MKMADRKYYEELEIPERDISKYPNGFKHYSKEEIFESNTFEFSLLKYKLKRLLIGSNNKEKHRKRNYDIDYAPIIRKVVYIDEEYKPTI